MNGLTIFQAGIFMLIVVLYFPSDVQSGCSIIPYPQKYLNCCLSLESSSDEGKLTGEEINGFCLQTYLVNTPEERWYRKSDIKSGFNYIGKLMTDSFKSFMNSSKFVDDDKDDGYYNRGEDYDLDGGYNNEGGDYDLEGGYNNEGGDYVLEGGYNNGDGDYGELYIRKKRQIWGRSNPPSSRSSWGSPPPSRSSWGSPPSSRSSWGSPPSSRSSWGSPPPSRSSWGSPPPSRSSWGSPPARSRSSWGSPPPSRSNWGSPPARSRSSWGSPPSRSRSSSGFPPPSRSSWGSPPARSRSSWGTPPAGGNPNWRSPPQRGAPTRGSPQARGGSPEPSFQRQPVARIVNANSYSGCTRREIRDLTPSQLDRFHRVISAARADTSLRPNVWQYFANWHSGNYIGQVHGGPSFLPWHRVFLLCLERALQKYDRGFCLPYWDPMFEYNMDNPQNSILFSNKYVGEGTSSVTGRYAGLGIFRSVGGSNSKELLISSERLNRVYNERRPENVVYNPDNGRSGQPASVIEILHNDVHQQVGGIMDDLSIAARDPLFYLHHCNVDRIWENWRIRHGINYPYGRGVHAADAVMPSFGEIASFSWLNSGDRMRIRHGVDSRWRNFVRYANPPRCGGGMCGASRDIICSNRVCASNTRVGRTTRGRAQQRPNRFRSNSFKRKKRSTLYSSFVTDDNNPAIQHSFYVNGKFDTSEWVYFPVLVTFIRPQGLLFNSYTVKGGKIQYGHDIFDTYVYSSLKKCMKMGNQKPFRTCKAAGSGQMKVYVQSNGKNYNGKLKEYAVADERFPISKSIAYVAIKKPTDAQPSEVFFSSFDECGRTCKPMCRVEGSSPPVYKRCSGILKIDNEKPTIYGDTLADAVLKHWAFNKPKTHIAPDTNGAGYPLMFICDASLKYPWDNWDDEDY